MNTSITSERLIKARGKMTQKEAADAMGISQSSLALYESGKRVPRDEIKEVIAHFYGKSVAFLFFPSNFTNCKQ